MPDWLIKFLATGLGLGWVPKAPGTAGTLLGVVLWWGMRQIAHPWVWWCYPILVILAIWIAGRAAELLRDSDPSSVVIDEIIAMPIALAGCDVVAWKIIVGFAAFRLFDIWKPCPVYQAQRLAGGAGIVVDDLLAAGYACALTQAIVWIVSSIRP